RRLEYSTFLGGSDREFPNGILWDSDQHTVWLAGTSDSHDLPVTPNALVPDDHGVEHGYGFYLCYDLPEDSAGTAPKPLPVPQTFSLSTFPNPFNPTTTLSFTLPAPSEVKLEVFDVLGRCVYQREFGRMSAGEQRYRFEGSELSSGVYFARVAAGSNAQVRKMVMLK
ncbi:MAG TPA: T9SS type A sorting domain-containing protein, partial [bacterium]